MEKQTNKEEILKEKIEEPKIEETEQFKDHSTLFYDPYEKKDNNLVSDEEKDDLFGDHTDDEKNNDIKRFKETMDYFYMSDNKKVKKL